MRTPTVIAGGQGHGVRHADCALDGRLEPPQEQGSRVARRCPGLEILPPGRVHPLAAKQPAQPPPAQPPGFSLRRSAGPDILRPSIGRGLSAPRKMSLAL